MLIKLNTFIRRMADTRVQPWLKRLSYSEGDAGVREMQAREIWQKA